MPPALLDELTGEEASAVWRDRWREAIGNPPTSRHRVLTAVTDAMPREVVGFVSAGPATDADRWPGTDAEIYEFRVAPDRTGQGHGGRLMHAVADTLVGDGFRTVSIWVLEADAWLAPLPRIGGVGHRRGPGRAGRGSERARWCGCIRRSVSDGVHLGSVRG